MRPNRGFFVMNLDVDDIAVIYFARTVVERVAALRLVESKNGGALDALQRCVDETRRALERATRPSLLGGILEFHKPDAGGSEQTAFPACSRHSLQ